VLVQVKRIKIKYIKPIKIKNKIALHILCAKLKMSGCIFNTVVVAKNDVYES